jgi:hypothetical protein
MIWMAPAWAFDVVELGDSNANSTRADSVWGGRPVVGLYSHNGVVQQAWPASNNPGVGKLPYLMALSGEPGCVIRRAQNGSRASAGAGQLAGAVADVARLGCVPDLVVVTFGANDSRKAEWAELYLPTMTELVVSIRQAFPDAEIVLPRETCSDVSSLLTYRHLRTTIYAALDQLGALPGVRVLDTAACDRVDAIHWSTGGTGGGQECLANLILERPLPPPLPSTP